ncbi:hypothetical protein [Pseudonocardia sp. GCM10023141]|uniref:hypothetical protein n=1 Tax=Pseudonocardia sp. GCM10023141 TaxID=3252653 RepID=UPI003619E036
MNAWINLDAVGLILGLGLVFGAGLPALFAVGLRALSATGSPAPVTGDGAAEVGPVRMTAAVLCFAGVVAAVAAGIYLIVAMS